MQIPFPTPNAKGPVAAALALTCLYVIARLVLGLNNYIVILNGVLFGFFFAYAIAFADLFRDALTNLRPYDRVKRMATGIFVVSLAVVLMIYSSIYNRVTDTPVVLSEISPLVRYLALVGFAVQISAPDFGRGLFYGRDRRLLMLAGLTGGVIAIVVISLQTS